jgi:lactaldehyde dehydrogenase/glycolaldehyde dehydrogenase
MSISISIPKTYQMYIDGRWVDASTGNTIEVENPTDESIIATVPSGSVEDAELALLAAQKAQVSWGRLTAVQRAVYIVDLAKELEINKERLATIITMEQGKPLNNALGEVDAAIRFLTYSAEHARRIEGDIVPADKPNEHIWIHKVPYGVTVALLAWNFPLALAARKLGNALVCGNTMIVKPHSITPLAVLELAKLAEKVHFPTGVLSVITGTDLDVGETLVASKITSLVTLTGSTRAGQAVSRAGADQITVMRLELGGKAPFIVMDDADLDKAAEAAVSARFGNCGQICTCNERMYIHEHIYDEFMGKLLDRTSKLTVGNPMDNPDIGPKVSRMEVEKVEHMVNEAVQDGAEVLLGGKRLTEGQYEKGFWFEPTVLGNVNHTMNIMKKEIFGPVLPVMKITDFEQALELANDSDYGLSAYLFTKDMKKIMRLVNELHFGEVYVNRANGEAINGFHNGFKMSGLGGEDGKYGLEGYLQKKIMYVNFND